MKTRSRDDRKNTPANIEKGPSVLTIFDCDGILVDSEALAARIFSEQLALVGVTLTAEQCHAKFKGFTLNDCIHSIEQDFQSALAPDFQERLKHATEEGFTHALKPVRGVEQVLSWLRASNRAMCVASNGGAKKIRHSLAITGLTAYFDQFFSAEMVEQGKPSPDLFLLAAKTLGFAPARCVVIEDSIQGVRAAQAAGMQVLLYREGNTEATVGIETFTDMDQLPRLLQRVWQRMEEGRH